MKITKAGVFVWSATGDIVTSGFEFDMEGAPPPSSADALACILNHIAITSGLRVASPADPVAAAGLAEDLIERARRNGAV